MKTLIRRTALTSIAILFLLGGTTAAFADNNQHDAQASQTLTGTMIGAVLNLGTQTYSVSGGTVAAAYIGGQPVDPTTATIKYSFFATQKGFTTKGFAHIDFSGMTATGSVSVEGNFNINNTLPAAAVPLGCTTTCNSELPYNFLGSSSNVQVTVGGSTQTVTETMQFESPYWNPFGAPIVLASTDNSIIIAATYTRGTIVWKGTQVGGTIAGLLGTTPASGSYTLTSGEVENLVNGSAIDAGQIQFSSMTPSSLNARGFYGGNSSIPTSPTVDCSPAGLPGTCTATGFLSTGKFRMGGITGSYSTNWGIPALQPTSTLTAQVSQHGASGDR